ncbi:MAG: GHKL domain-containing protein [Ruminiclostridium sp.]|nr:GHKL domain-containing protein [Ruminiclostridium sp.]
MKHGVSKLLPALFAAAAVIALNAVLFWYAGCTGEYLQTSDIYGRQYSENRAETRRVSELLASSDCGRTALENRIEYFTEVISAAETMARNRTAGREEAQAITDEFSRRYGIYDYKEMSESAKTEQQIYETALSKLGYAESYSDYVSGIAGNAETLSDIAIFGSREWIKNNIVRTQKDFYGLENIRLAVTAGNAPGALVNYHMSDIFALLTVFAVIPFFTVFSGSIRSTLSPERRLLILPVIIAVLSSAAMYFTDFVMTQTLIGEIKLDAAVQSYEPFRSCPFAVSTGMMLTLCLLAKLAGVLLFSLVLLFVVSRRKHRGLTAALTGVFTVFEAAAHISGAFGTVLQEINIFSLFTFERFFIRYLNLDIFGAAVSRLPVFAVFTTVLAAVVCVAAPLSVSRYIRTAREAAEHDYYDEINRRYTESRKIKHDINNHLLAVSRLIESGNIEAAKKYISEVSEKTDLTAQPVKTGSDVLDALLYKKAGQADNAGLKLETEITAPVPEGVSDYDLCTIFGNILDNAFEAAPPDSAVKLTISHQHEMVYIACENPFSGEIRRENGRIITAKADSSAHGYGLARVSEVAAKYGGTVRISTENNIFRIEILIIK